MLGNIKIQTLLIYVVLIYLLLNSFGLIGKWLGWHNDGVRTDIVEEVRTDTVRVFTERVIIKEPVVTQETRKVTVPFNSEEYLPLDSLEKLPTQVLDIPLDSIKIDIPIREYSDSIAIGDAGLKYNLRVAGFLQPNPRFELFYPERFNTTTITQTQVKNRLFDVMVGGSAYLQPSTGYEVSAALITKRWMVDAGVGTVLVPNFEEVRTFRVGAKFRIFGH